MTAATMTDTNIEQAARFLGFMAEGEPVTFQTFDDGPQKRAHLARILHGDLEQHADTLAKLNGSGAGIYWLANYGDGTGRKAENVTGVRCLFLDLDGAPLGPVLGAGVEPHAVIESSPGKWHVYWQVTGCPLDKFKPAQRALAAKFNGDPSVCDLPRVMRLPGFLHQKADPFAVRVESLEPLQPYEFGDLVRRLALKPEAKTKSPPPDIDPDTGEIHGAGKVKEGGRRTHLVRLFGTLNRKGLTPEAIMAATLAENQSACDPPMPEAEVTAMVADCLRRYADEHATDPIFGGMGAKPPAWAVPAPIAADEMAGARLTPRCIVENYLFADVGTLIAPGSTGKTTATLYEAVHIVLGLPLWGLRVFTPGPVLIVTAEDRREFLVARLREICAALRLSDEQMQRVRGGIRIDDRTVSMRKLTAIVCDIVAVADFARQIVEAARDLAPVLAQFDPLVSFGVGEARVNDAEQGLIEAGRVISGGLDCAVRYVHHTGKGPALEKRVDQYTGRGGSALADGCRMVAVMQALDDGEMAKATGEALDEGESAFALHRPKVSYGPPQKLAIYVRRRGYAFEVVRAKTAQSPDERARAVGEQLARFIQAELHDGRRHTRNTLEQLRPESLSRPDVRLGLAWLSAAGRLHDADVLDEQGKKPATGARTYLVADGEPMARRAA